MSTTSGVSVVVVCSTILLKYPIPDYSNPYFESYLTTTRVRHYHMSSSYHLLCPRLIHCSKSTVTSCGLLTFFGVGEGVTRKRRKTTTTMVVMMICSLLLCHIRWVWQCPPGPSWTLVPLHRPEADDKKAASLSETTTPGRSTRYSRLQPVLPTTCVFRTLQILITDMSSNPCKVTGKGG